MMHMYIGGVYFQQKRHLEEELRYFVHWESDSYDFDLSYRMGL